GRRQATGLRQRPPRRYGARLFRIRRLRPRGGAVPSHRRPMPDDEGPGMDERVKRRRERAHAAGDGDDAPLPLHPGARSAARVAVAVVLVGAALWIAREFLPALLWAAMLAIALWPIYEKAAERVWGRPSGASAFVFTIAVAIVVFLPVVLVT